VLKLQVRAVLFSLFASCAIVCTPVANAGPVVVNAGETVIFDFDFIAAGISPAPPYGTLDFRTGTDTSTIDPSDSGFWAFFSDRGGVGPLFTAVLNTSGAGFGGGPGGVVADDGIFSVSLTMTGGSITVDPYARGINWLPSNLGELFFTANVFPSRPSQVPEPNSLVLAGLAFVLLGLSRVPCRLTATSFKSRRNLS
jgi:hypothetical protein